MKWYSIVHKIINVIFPFILGSVYYNKCTIENKIPIFLIVFGCISLLQTTYGVFKLIMCDKTKNKIHASIFEAFISIFLVIWIIVGSYYTFNVYSDWLNNGKQSCSNSQSDAATLCCDAVPMYFTFVLLILIHIFGIPAVFVLLIIFVILVCTSEIVTKIWNNLTKWMNSFFSRF